MIETPRVAEADHLNYAPHVYLAGPMRSSGILERNIQEAVLIADELMNIGFIPFVPQLNVLWNFITSSERTEEEWLMYDFQWILRCDALLRLSGHSVGGDREVEFARQRSIPVFFDIVQLRHFYRR